MTMTETTFPFNDAPEEAVAPAPNRRNLLLAGGLAAVLLVGGGGYYLFGTSSADDTAVAFTPRPVRTGAPATKTAVKAPTKAKPAAVTKVPATSTEHLGHDPFKALYVQPVAAAAPLTPAAVPGAMTGTTPATTSVTTGTAPTTTTTGTTTTGTPTTGTTSAAGTPYPLQLVSVSKPSPETRFFVFKVAGVSKTVIPAQRFGKYGELIVLAYTKTASGTVTGAIIQVGDDSPMGVAIGEKVTVL